ncbi:MAG: KAP family P-loop NTPase fold protein, partial [Pyrinomonadaceae bacterium]
MTPDKSLMPSLLDVEINSSVADAFGHRHFAKALQGLVESSNNKPPYSIGLLGKWGTGKSSIKSIYLKALEDDLTKNSEDVPRNARIFSITFNAWRFGGENIKRALLRHVYLSLAGNAEKLNDALFRQIQRPAKEDRTWKAILKDFYEQWIWGALPGLFLLVLIVVLFLIIGWIFGYSNPWTAAPIIALATCAGLIFRYLLDPKRLFVSRFATINRVELPSSSAEQYEDLLLEQLRTWKYDIGKKCERLVIFVDDLDRLSAEEMVSGLDAVRTFMEIQRTDLPSGFGIVFVISCDEERIAEALANRRKQGNSDLPGGVIGPADARRFLDRIFQFRLEIPQFPKGDMRNYAMKRLTNDLSVIAKDLRDKGVSLETLVDYMIHVDVQSPRNALQILNAFAQSWWIARQRELEGAGTDRPGGLHEGAVTDHPLSLAALSALRVDFANFYEDLQTEPELIGRFTQVFVHGDKLDDEPDAMRATLEKYATQGGLKTQYRPLRQFIAGLQGIKWPVSLQPLLILSEDPLTRKYGNKAFKLYSAFVQGDHAGVLAELGRDADVKTLSDEDVRFLRSMEEEVRRETETRRDNAARVIAALADRLPEAQAHLLVSPLARRLAQSHDLRSFIGIDRIQTLLPKALPEDRRDVAALLIQDLLRTDDSAIDFTLPSGEEPSLEEAIEMVRVACEVVLTIRGQDGLDNQPDRQLLDWLESRTVSIGNQNYEFAFAEFEEWITRHEDHLLRSFRQRYTNLAIAQLEADEIRGVDIEGMLRKVRFVFEALWDAGEESRQELWNQLSRLASVREKDAVALAWEFMALHANAPETTMATLFVKNMAERLRKGMDEAWPLDWETGGRAFLDLLHNRISDVQSSAYDAITKLNISWSRDNATGTFAVRLLSLLAKKDAPSRDKVIDDWTVQIITELADNAITWLATEFESLSSSHQTKIAASLSPLHERTKITEQESQDFATFIKPLSDESVTSVAIKTFLTELYPYVQAQHSNPNEYLYRVFPPLPRILQLGPAPEVGSMLHTLFANSRSDLTVYAWLHEQMTGSWPPKTSETGPYDPSQIFAATLQSIGENPSDTNAPKLLDAARDMFKRGVSAAENDRDVIEGACRIWPHYPDKALSVFESSEQTPTSADASSLMNTVDYASDESKANLNQAWSHFASHWTEDQVNEGAKLILGKKPKGSSDDPDAAFGIWINVQKARKGNVLRALLTDDSLTDSQRKRVW